MKQFMKKLALILLVLALVLPAAFAKGKTETTAAAPKGPVDIEIWYGALASESGPPPDDWVVYDIVKEKLNINLTLTALPSSQDDQTVKVNAAGAANALPDLFMVDRSSWLKLIDQGLIADVDDMYAKMPKRTATHYDAASRAFTTVDGKSYGLADPGTIVRNEGVLIRKDWLDNLGLSVPVTTEDYLAVMKAFTFNDPDGNGKDDTWGFGAYIESAADALGLGRRFDPFAGAFDVAGVWDMSTGKLNLYKDSYFDMLTYVKEMVDAKVIDPNWTSYKKDDFRAAWKQGKFGIMREQMAAYANEANYKPFDQNFPEGQWIVIDPPKGPKGFSGAGTFDPAGGFRIYAVSQDAADAGKKDAIASLLEWMADESADGGYWTLAYGVEGVNYTKDANGLPSKDGLADPTLAYTESKGVPYCQLRNLVSYNGDIELGLRYPTYTAAKSGKTMSALVTLREMQAKAWYDGTSQSTMPTPNADVKRFYEEGVIKFVTGNTALTKANWDAFIAEFEKVGGKAWAEDGYAYATSNGILHSR